MYHIAKIGTILLRPILATHKPNLITLWLSNGHKIIQLLAWLKCKGEIKVKIAKKN